MSEAEAPPGILTKSLREQNAYAHVDARPACSRQRPSLRRDAGSFGPE
jgi:hypothetical protein